MSPRIFVTQPIAKSAMARLSGVAIVRTNPDATRVLPKRALIEAARTHDILFTKLHDRVDRAVMTANPALRAVASQSITPDNIDVPEATRRGIVVTVVPPIVAEATADIHFGLILAVARRIVEGDRLVRRGSFPGAQSNLLAGHGVYGRTIGLVGGGGRIGQATARRARGFGMRVIYWGPRRNLEAERELSMEYLPFDELLRQADFVSVHSPLRPETYHQIGERELALMKPEAFLINTARGPVVDETALLRALKRGQIAGAGLDVFEHEPKVPVELRKLPNVVLTPHLGSAVTDVREQMENIVADNILALLESRRPPNIINPEVMEGCPRSRSDARAREPARDQANSGRR